MPEPTTFTGDPYSWCMSFKRSKRRIALRKEEQGYSNFKNEKINLLFQYKNNKKNSNKKK